MAKKKEAASRLLKALGKTKKDQMAKLYPKVKGKGPYVRGTIGKKGASDFVKRRAVMSGIKSFPKPTKKRGMSAGEMAAHVVGAGAAGYAVGKGWHKKLAGAVTPKKKETHREKAIRGAKELVKKQKAKKEKHHSR